MQVPPVDYRLSTSLLRAAGHAGSALMARAQRAGGQQRPMPAANAAAVFGSAEMALNGAIGELGNAATLADVLVSPMRWLVGFCPDRRPAAPYAPNPGWLGRHAGRVVDALAPPSPVAPGVRDAHDGAVRRALLLAVDLGLGVVRVACAAVVVAFAVVGGLDGARRGFWASQPAGGAAVRRSVASPGASEAAPYGAAGAEIAPIAANLPAAAMAT